MHSDETELPIYVSKCIALDVIFGLRLTHRTSDFLICDAFLIKTSLSLWNVHNLSEKTYFSYELNCLHWKKMNWW